MSVKDRLSEANKGRSLDTLRYGRIFSTVRWFIFEMLLFEAHIRSNSSGLTLSSGFTRLDRYGRQGDCLVGNALRSLCHCKGTTVPPDL
ncbi:hypothetical protein DICVIV_07396 [Dictyocaulus viviparus]|uniref:Uncharacterized protein n=1 Tax=Dictyocaulus viviparus TaxID=29172 RepID=A0A0D8XPF5_DICVI|nr:hypothetical protein DICVIV_07396 [Dictyocaulus viviparus]